MERPTTCHYTQPRNRTKFEGETTYMHEYSPKRVERVEQKIPVTY
jgi:hypothetical protein